MTTTQPQIGKRRTDSWWEPCFDPTLHNPLPVSDWKFETSAVAQRSFLAADTLCEASPVGEVAKFKKLNFTACNFQGLYDHQPSILFDDCRFSECDFAFSTWKNATFRNCRFSSCSLSLSSFKDCEFRDCEWDRIGFSGIKTDFERTFVTNPTDFVAAGFSGHDPDRVSDQKHIRYQKFRLEGTKAHIARSLLYSHERVGDDHTFYETAKIHDVQQNRARCYRQIYDLMHGKGLKRCTAGAMLPLTYVERALLYVMGLLNGWGARILRPLIGLAVTTLIFGVIYRFVPFSEAIDHPWQMAFDISNVTGYGSHMKPNQSAALRRVEAVHLILAILFYTVFFSTAVARNSRSR